MGLGKVCGHLGLIAGRIGALCGIWANCKSFLSAPHRRATRVRRVELTASSPREMNPFFLLKNDLRVEEMLKSESTSGSMRKPRVPRRQIDGTLPTPREQIPFLVILTGQGHLHAHRAG